MHPHEEVNKQHPFVVQVPHLDVAAPQIAPSAYVKNGFSCTCLFAGRGEAIILLAPQ